MRGTGLTADVISLSAAISTYEKRMHWAPSLALLNDREKGRQWGRNWHYFTRYAKLARMPMMEKNQVQIQLQIQIGLSSKSFSRDFGHAPPAPPPAPPGVTVTAVT